MFRQPTVNGDRPPQPYRMINPADPRLSGLRAFDPEIITEYGDVVLTDLLRPCTEFRHKSSFPGKAHITHELRCVETIDRREFPTPPIQYLFCIKCGANTNGWRVALNKSLRAECKDVLGRTLYYKQCAVRLSSGSRPY